MPYIKKRRAAAIGILNSQMSIQTRIRLYNTYIKPLINYGSETIDFTMNELKCMKKLEGNSIKKVLDIANKWVSTSLYGALKIDTTENDIIKQQIKFIMKAKRMAIILKLISS